MLAFKADFDGLELFNDFISGSSSGSSVSLMLPKGPALVSSLLLLSDYIDVSEGGLLSASSLSISGSSLSSTLASSLSLASSSLVEALIVLFAALLLSSFSKSVMPTINLSSYTTNQRIQ